MQRTPRMDGGYTTPRSERSMSMTSERPSLPGGFSSSSQVPTVVNPPPQYVAVAAASQMVTDNQNAQHAQLVDEAEISDHCALFSEGALGLVNAFLDNLLYVFLANARSTSFSALRPAVTEVLKQRLAREAIASAEEELQELLDGGEDEDELLQDGQTSANWSLEAVWKRTRLRVMVYIRLGEMEDEDEERYVEEGGLQDMDHSFVSWASAIFLTSVIEYVAEQALLVAGRAAYSRVKTRRRNQGTAEAANGIAGERVVVEVSDAEKIALSTALGRLWRTWRKSVRSPTTTAPGTPHRRGASLGSHAHRSIDGNLRDIYDSRRPSLANIHDGVPSETDIAANIPLPPTPDVLEEDEYAPPEHEHDLRSDGTATPVRAKSQRPHSMMMLPMRMADEDGSAEDASMHPHTLHRVRSSSLPTMRSEQGAPLTQRNIDESTFVTPMETLPNRNSYIESDNSTVEDEGAEIVDMRASTVSIHTPSIIEIRRSASGSRASSPLSSPIGDGYFPHAPIAQRISGGSTSGSQSDARGLGLSTPSIEEAHEEVDAPPSHLDGTAQSAQDTTSKHADEGAVTGNVLKEYEKQAEPEASSFLEEASPDEDDITPPAPAYRAVDPTVTRDFAGAPQQRTFSQIPAEPAVQSFAEPTAPPVQPLPVPPRAQGNHYTPGISRKPIAERTPSGNVATYKPQPAEATTVSDSPTKVRTPAHRVAATPPFDRVASSPAQTFPERSSSRDGNGPRGRANLPEHRRRDFESLVRGDDTMKYTLTPEPARSVPETHSDTSSQDARSTRPQVETTVGQESNGARTTVTPTNQPVSTPASTYRTPVSPKAIAEAKAIPRPLPQNSAQSKKGLMAREPRIQTESTRDFSDFIRSTGPDNEPLPVRLFVRGPSGSGTPSTRGDASVHGTEMSSARSFTSQTVSKVSVGPHDSPSKSATPSRPVTSTSRKMNLQPREARSDRVPSNGTAELIDFIRQGPPSGPNGAHRIPRSVAPFRTTMDSDELNTLVNDNRQTSMASSQLSNGRESNMSRSTLASNSSRAPLISENGRSSAGPNPGFAAQPQPQRPQPNPNDFLSPGDDPMPVRKRVRRKDPYAIDSSDEEDDLLTALPKPKPREESLIDFLRNSEPPESNQPVTPFNISGQPGMSNRSAGKIVGPLPPHLSGQRPRTGASQNGRKNSGPTLPPLSERPVTATPPSKPRVKLESRNAGSRDVGGGRFDTSELADFLKNSGPPPEPVRRHTLEDEEDHAKKEGKMLGVGRFFRKKSGVEA